MFAVIVLYDVDKAVENVQHLIKWIMDCYSDSCKLILLCESDASILDLVKSCCTTIEVEVPSTHEVSVHVLILLVSRSVVCISSSLTRDLGVTFKSLCMKSSLLRSVLPSHVKVMHQFLS